MHTSSHSSSLGLRAAGAFLASATIAILYLIAIGYIMTPNFLA